MEKFEFHSISRNFFIFRLHSLIRDNLEVYDRTYTKVKDLRLRDIFFKCDFVQNDDDVSTQCGKPRNLLSHSVMISRNFFADV